MTSDDYAAMVLVQRLRDQADSDYSKDWLQRTLNHLTDLVDRQLREVPVIRTDRQALAMMKTLAVDFGTAATALDQAAAALRDAGEPRAASEAKQAATEARRAAAGLVGE